MGILGGILGFRAPSHYAKGGVVYDENYHHYNNEALMALANPDPSIPGMMEVAAEYQARMARVPRKPMPQAHVSFPMKLKTKVPAKYKKWAKARDKRAFAESQVG